MQSKADRVMCGTCMYWNGQREVTNEDKPKIVMLEQEGICECPISSKLGESRKRDLKCKSYLQWWSQGK